jgi:hypothetical protein
MELCAGGRHLGADMVQARNKDLRVQGAFQRASDARHLHRLLFQNSLPAGQHVTEAQLGRAPAVLNRCGAVGQQVNPMARLTGERLCFASRGRRLRRVHFAQSGRELCARLQVVETGTAFACESLRASCVY